MNQKYGRLSGKEAVERGYGEGSKVIFNGIEIRNCVLFDDIEGWVEVLDLDEKGYPYTDPNSESLQAKTSRYCGEVRYIPRKVSIDKKTDAVVIEHCQICGELLSDCDCTGGPQIGDPECTCYEPAYGHQPGCPYYGRKVSA